MSVGKGKGPEKGRNLIHYRENFPFPERKTVSQWTEDLDIILYGEIGTFPGQRLTEAEFRERATKVGFVYKTEGPNVAEKSDKP